MSRGTLSATSDDAHRAIERASLILRLALVFPAYWIVSQAVHWREFTLREAPDALWPVAWATNFEPHVVSAAATVGSVLGLVALAVMPQFRWARVAGAVALTEYLSLRFSLGKIHHLMHGWLMVLWVCCWLPRNWTAPEVLNADGHRKVLVCFHTCQLLVAATYTLSGVGKVLGVIYQWSLGQVTLLNVDSLSRHTAARLLETPTPSVLGAWVVRHGQWLWPGALGILFLQLAAFWMARRPGLHGPLGALLIVFHALTTLVMGIDFAPAVMLCGALYLASPFHDNVARASLDRHERGSP